jgi:tRNA threonylcarbamoyl adenosine modification protein (Sua5/YciO/YrdC/YwlC family)
MDCKNRGFSLPFVHFDYFCAIFFKAMLLKLYPTDPNPRYVKMILECLTDGGVIIFPTDTIYGLGGCINQPKTLERICQLKGIRKEKANFSFIFHDLSMLSDFTKPINNDVFKMMKRNLPGPFTFILNGTTRLPKIFRNRKEVGIRMPDNSIVQELSRLLDAPIMSTSLPLPDGMESDYITNPELIDELFGERVDIVIDGGMGGTEVSTIINCTDGEAEIIRQGIGWLEE